MRSWVLLAGTVASIGLLTACGDDSGPQAGQAPQLEAVESGRTLFDQDTVTVGAASGASIRLSNVGDGRLVIKGFSIESDPPGSFTLQSSPMPSSGSPINIMPEAVPHVISVGYDAVASGGARPRGTVTIHTNTQLNGTDTMTIRLSLGATTARLVAQPDIVDFTTVPENAQSTKPVALLNTGDAELSISGFEFSGHPGFSVSIGGEQHAVSAATVGGVTLAEALVIPPGESRHLDLTYTAGGPEAAEGELILFSNDAGSADGTVVEMFANVAGPCIAVTPGRVDFGGKLVAQGSTINVMIESCGDRDLDVEAITFFDDAGGVFTLDTSALGQMPIAIAPGSSIVVPVTYTPTQVAPFVDGSPQLDEGFFRVVSNAYLRDFDVEVFGFGTDGSCPTAEILVAEGQEVAPQTVLHLNGTNSTASNGSISRYEWSVTQPSGSASTFLPSRTAPSPSFEANVVGEYIFRLKVWDTLDTESCSEATYSVLVTSDEAIHVELLWRTPGDANETDTGFTLFGESVGSDMDLHFAHPQAQGLDLNNDFQYDGWFDTFYDCFWQNKTPNWGSNSPNDNPSLDRDDTDGAGPENLNLSVPENGRAYDIGVHYWDDWGYGVSFATIRVYIYGDLRYQRDNVQLINRDMWEVGSVEWPSGYINAPQTPKVIRNYWNPLWGP